MQQFNIHIIHASELELVKAYNGVLNDLAEFLYAFYTSLNFLGDLVEANQWLVWIIDVSPVEKQSILVDEDRMEFLDEDMDRVDR